MLKNWTYNSLADFLVDSDDDAIYDALLAIALRYPAAFQSIQRETALAAKAAAYFNASRGA